MTRDVTRDMDLAYKDSFPRSLLVSNLDLVYIPATKPLLIDRSRELVLVVRGRLAVADSSEPGRWCAGPQQC